jgi:hypothetical protein
MTRHRTVSIRSSHISRLNNDVFGCAMTDNAESAFAVVRFNERTYQSWGVLAVIKGIDAAQRTLGDFEVGLSEENKRVGWCYFLEEADLRPGMDPEKATKLSTSAARSSRGVSSGREHPSFAQSHLVGIGFLNLWHRLLVVLRSRL